MATGKPLIGVSALDALVVLAGARKVPTEFVIPSETPEQAASRVPGNARVVAWIEAWRGDVFSATYEGGRALDEPVVAHPDDLLKHMREHAALFIGDGAARNLSLIRAVLGDNAHLADPIAPLLAGAVARVASEALNSGQHQPPHAIRPLYVRRSDAGLTTNASPV
jgi:tRNA A37 threonylcarbamoyladenosine modification protein TsaB